MFFYALWNLLDSHFIIFGIVLYFVQMISYTYTFMKNPGIPINKENSLEMTKNIEENKHKKNKGRKGYQFCNICHIYVDTKSNTNHCEDCNVCIEGNRVYLYFRLRSSLPMDFKMHRERKSKGVLCLYSYIDSFDA